MGTARLRGSVRLTSNRSRKLLARNRVPHALGGEEARPVNIMRAIETMATASGGVNNGVSRTPAPTDSGSPANKSSLAFLTKLLGESTR